MTEKKMKQINAWIQRVNKNKLEMQDKMAIAGRWNRFTTSTTVTVATSQESRGFHD